MVRAASGLRFSGSRRLLGRRGGFFPNAAQLVFELRHAVVEALQNFPRFRRHGHAVLAMMARGGAAFDGIFKFPAAGAAGALALAGSLGRVHGRMCFACGLWTSQQEKSEVIVAI